MDDELWCLNDSKANKPLDYVPYKMKSWINKDSIFDLRDARKIIHDNQERCVS